jgi:hypothetical protein
MGSPGARAPPFVYPPGHTDVVNTRGRRFALHSRPNAVPSRVALRRRIHSSASRFLASAVRCRATRAVRQSPHGRQRHRGHRARTRSLCTRQRQTLRPALRALSSHTAWATTAHIDAPPQRSVIFRDPEPPLHEQMTHKHTVMVCACVHVAGGERTRWRNVCTVQCTVMHCETPGRV